MTDYTWPQDLVPIGSSFRLQPHTGGSESPFSRKTKVYGLAAPRWTCSLSLRSVRGSRWGRSKAATAARIDSIITMLKGRQNRIAIWDFDYPLPRGGLAFATGNLAAVAGATTLTITGMAPGSQVWTGDYLGGDGRPHQILSSDFSIIAATADSSGQAVVTFEPPLAANIASNAATFKLVTGLFRLTSDDAGENYNEAGEALTYALQFVEDL